MTSLFRSIAAATLLLGVVGCASRPKYLKIVTTPTDAEISVDGEPAGKSPLRFDLTGRKHFIKGRHVITARKEGYVENSKELGPAYFKEKSNITYDDEDGEKGIVVKLSLLKDSPRSLF